MSVQFRSSPPPPQCNSPVKATNAQRTGTTNNLFSEKRLSELEQ